MTRRIAGGFANCGRIEACNRDVCPEEKHGSEEAESHGRTVA